MPVNVRLSWAGAALLVLGGVLFVPTGIDVGLSVVLLGVAWVGAAAAVVHSTRRDDPPGVE